jgi:hypothetical protein
VILTIERIVVEPGLALMLTATLGVCALVAVLPEARNWVI